MLDEISLLATKYRTLFSSNIFRSDTNDERTFFWNSALAIESKPVSWCHLPPGIQLLSADLSQ